MTRSWKGWLGITLSVVLLWWTLRGVSLPAVWDVLRHAHLLLFAASTLVSTCIFPLRARRWQTILEPTAGVLPFGALWRSTAIGIMVSNIFPFKAGEFARPLALTREQPRLKVSTALASLAVDRIFDAIVVFTMMFSAMLDPAFPSGVTLGGRTVPQLAAGAVVVVVTLLLVCYSVVLQPARAMRVVYEVAHRVIPKHEALVVQFVEHAIGGLAVLKDSRRFLAVLAWATAHWLVNAFGIYLGLLAVGIDVPVSAAFFLQGALGLAASIPSAPGFFGTFEAFAKVGLGVYGVPSDLAVSWAIGYHLLTFIPITAFGAYYAARLGVSVSSLRRAEVGS